MPSDLMNKLRSVSLGKRQTAKGMLVYFQDGEDGLRLLEKLPELKPEESLPESVQVFELRAPSIADRGRVLTAAMTDESGKTRESPDLAELQARALVVCTYVPSWSEAAPGQAPRPALGGAEQPFNEKDLRQLVTSAAGTWVDVLGKKAQDLLQLDAGAVGKGSGKTATAS